MGCLAHVKVKFTLNIIHSMHMNAHTKEWEACIGELRIKDMSKGSKFLTWTCSRAIQAISRFLSCGEILEFLKKCD